MISRRTTLLIADIICNEFTHRVYDSNSRRYTSRISEDLLRNFLFEFNIDGFTINKICKCYYNKSDLKKQILDMHTGYFYNKTEYNSFVSLGQKDIKGIAIGILYKKLQPESLNSLENLLRIDGYIYEKEKIYEINTDVDDKANIIKNQFYKFGFNNQEEFDTFYANMNEHFENSKWEDSIHNSRKLYEIVLKECAIYYSKNIAKDNIDLSNAKPVDIRLYLEKNNYFSEDESNIIQYYYKYLSNIGSHPKLALEEQADFSRVMSINTILYAINRLDKFK
ncbi:MAG: hypothetical protein IJ105_01645 [Bacilli bacterium]|nr:hypothetical protein [Bacilli bacterium]